MTLLFSSSSTNKKFSSLSIGSACGKTYKSARKVSGSKTSCSLKLDTSRSYTFRIRSYKTVDGKKIYSSWSEPVTVK